MAALPGEGDRYGRFLLRRELGRAPGGAVFEAYDPDVRDLVALHVRDASEQGGTLYLVTGLAPVGGQEPDELVWEHEGQQLRYTAPEAGPEPAPEPVATEPTVVVERPLVVEPEPTVAVERPLAPEAPAHHARNAVMVGLVLVSLAAIVLGGLAIARLGSEDADQPADTAAEPTAEAAPPSAEVPPAPAPVPAPAATFTCWNGTAVPAADQCPAPSGDRGIDWVFPGVAGENCRPKRQDATPGRSKLVECRFRGDDAVVLLSFWKRTPKATGYFTTRLGLGDPDVKPASIGEVLTWQARVPESYRFRAARLFTSYGYSWQIKARDAELRDRLVASNVLVPRPGEEYFGTPTG